MRTIFTGTDDQHRTGWIDRIDGRLPAQPVCADEALLNRNQATGRGTLAGALFVVAPQTQLLTRTSPNQQARRTETCRLARRSPDPAVHVLVHPSRMESGTHVAITAVRSGTVSLRYWIRTSMAMSASWGRTTRATSRSAMVQAWPLCCSTCVASTPRWPGRTTSAQSVPHCVSLRARQLHWMAWCANCWTAPQRSQTSRGRDRGRAS